MSWIYLSFSFYLSASWDVFKFPSFYGRRNYWTLLQLLPWTPLALCWGSNAANSFPLPHHLALHDVFISWRDEYPGRRLVWNQITLRLQCSPCSILVPIRRHHSIPLASPANLWAKRRHSVQFENTPGFPHGLPETFIEAYEKVREKGFLRVLRNSAEANTPNSVRSRERPVCSPVWASETKSSSQPTLFVGFNFNQIVSSAHSRRLLNSTVAFTCWRKVRFYLLGNWPTTLIKRETNNILENRYKNSMPLPTPATPLFCSRSIPKT